MRTLGSVSDERSGFGPGFDFVRIALALLVMGFHVASVLNKSDAWELQPYWIISYSIVPMFFALSGFLISASAMRLSLFQFLLNRGLRIIPALLVEIVLSAVLIGPLFTSFSLKEYFADPLFLHYFTNIVGLINYQLPGLFHENGQPGIVNAALWTIPYEIICYVIISGIIILSLFKRPVILGLAIMAFTIFPGLLPADTRDHLDHIPLLHWWIFGRGAFLFPSFLMGCLFYSIRYRIPYHFSIFAASVVILAGVSIFADHSLVAAWNISFILCFCITYIMAYVGMANMPKIPVISRGDYSYGVYLYHCPIGNCVYYFMPWVQSVWFLFFACVPPVALFAAFSWNFIEKPILKMRKKFSFVAKRLDH